MGNIRGGTLGFHGTIGQPTAQVIDGSLKFAKSEYLQRTPSSAGDRSVYTGSVWVKRSEFAPENNSNSNALSYTIFSAGTNTANNIDNIQFYKNAGDDSNRIAYESYPGSFQYNLMTTPRYRDPNGWYNVVWNYDGTTAKIYVNGEQVTSFDTNTQNGGSGGHFNNTVSHVIGHSPDAGYSKEYAGYMSQFYWIDGQVLGPEYFGFTDPLTNTWRPRKVKTSGPNDGTTWSSVSTISSGGANGGNVLTNGFNGSTSGAFEGDTSGATVTVPISTNIIRGGVRVYAAVTSSNPLVVVIKNGDTTVETINAGSSGGKYYGSSTYSGAITSLVISRTGRAPEFNAISINGIILKDNSTTNFEFGTNGFYLPMDNQDDFEKDKSGNGNDFTKNNFSGTSIDPDVVKDSPSGAVFGGRGQTGITTTSSAPANYCTWNPQNRTGMESTSITTSDGNLKAQLGSTGHVMITGNMAMPKGSGKYYWEIVTAGWNTSNQGPMAGIVGDTHKIADQAGGGPSILFRAAGEFMLNGSTVSTGHSTFTTNDVIGVALDLDRNIITWYKNGSQLFQYTSVSSSVNAWIPAWKDSDSGGNAVGNWGQKPFKYAPPQGFLPLNSATVRPNKVIARPDQYVGIVTYKGTGTTSQSIRGLNFDAKPDVVWIKDITSSSNYSYRIADSVRGSTNVLFTNATNGTQTNEYGTIDQFAFNGFDLRQGSNNNGDGSNTNGSTLIAWCFKAGGKVGSNAYNIDDVGYATAAAAGLDGGSISPTGASIGTKQGFSIIQYTGTDASSNTFSHGLTQAPDFALFKNTSQSGDDWIIYHSAIGATKRLKLNSVNAADSQTSQFNDTEPTSSLFTIGTYDNINKLNNSYIAYLWHNVPGLQKFGEYKGADTNGAIGHFVETGFRPAFLIVKKHDGTDGGVIMDSEYQKINPMRRQLRPNETGPYSDEYDAFSVDFYSNGFRVYGSTGQMNEYNKNFVYMAWAEAPAYNLFGGQSTAR
jgi:hypothetical protein